MDFNIKNLAVFEVGGVEVWITETIVNSWIIMALLIVFALVVRSKMKNFSENPKGLQNVVELLVETFDGFLRSTAGSKLQYLGPWFFTVFAFILISNISGIVPTFRPPTADWATTFACALVTFFMIQIVAVKHVGPRYLKQFRNPLNIVGECARPISLSFRLYGNVLAGTVLMTMMYTLAPIYVRFAIPVALHAFFDVAYGILQTFIFCVLSLAFIGVAAETAGE